MMPLRAPHQLGKVDWPSKCLWILGSEEPCPEMEPYPLLSFWGSSFLPPHTVVKHVVSK